METTNQALASATTQQSDLDQCSQADVDRLSATLARRRAEFGIEAKAPKPIPVSVPPVMSPERQAEITRLEAEAKTRRDREALKELIDGFYGREAGRYSGCDLANFDATSPAQKAALDACREYAASIEDRRALGEGMLLYGPCGTGKDHLAIAICREAIYRFRMPCERVNGSDWFGDVRDAMDSERPITEKRLIDRMCQPDFLLISDPLPPIGALTQHQATMLYRAIEARYFYGKPTIVTINVKDGREAEDRMGVATWDRLKGNAWVIACNWPSYRKPARIINGK